MSSLAEFIANHKQLPRPLEKTVIHQLFGNILLRTSYLHTAYPRMDPVYIGSAFKSFPVIPKRESQRSQAKRVMATCATPVAKIHKGILDAVQGLVENNVDIHWGTKGSHDNSVARYAVQRNLNEVLDDYFGWAYHEGNCEGQNEGVKVLTRVYGPLHPHPPALGPEMKTYRFRMDTMESDVDVGPTEVSLPVRVRSPEEREVPDIRKN